jgi:hypothetical protein
MKIFTTGLVLTLLTLPTMAAEIPYYGHPKMPHRMAEQLPCFMHLPESQSRTLSLDLSRLCSSSPSSNGSYMPQARDESRENVVETTIYTGSGKQKTRQYGGQSTGSPGSGTTSDGPCNNPDDLDRQGRRCGGRASSEKPGGR